tara:strand:- start:298 stop:780 length:483 start_codon:yes stop_codon:yes gene_type:complete
MSTLKVNGITHTDGSAFPFGKILQIVQKETTTSATTTSGSIQDYTGLTQAITLSDSSNKVLVQLNTQWQAFGDRDRRIAITLHDAAITNSNYIAQGEYGDYHSGDGSSYSFGVGTFTVLHTPGASSVTYRIGFKSIDGSTVGLQGASYTRSYITLMEVEA